jgi:hypothetical protein
VGASIDLGGVTVIDNAHHNIGGVALGGSLFGGYQTWLGRNWSFGALAVLFGVTSAKLTDSDDHDSGYRMRGVSLGVESVLLYY